MYPPSHSCVMADYKYACVTSTVHVPNSEKVSKVRRTRMDEWCRVWLVCTTKFFNFSRFPPITNLALCLTVPSVVDFRSRQNLPGKVLALSGMYYFNIMLKVPLLIIISISWLLDSIMACLRPGILLGQKFCQEYFFFYGWFAVGLKRNFEDMNKRCWQATWREEWFHLRDGIGGICVWYVIYMYQFWVSL